ncbi:MAG: phenylalanine--tRNA ligase subunit beta [Defluviitaleaceae bacterium]|nr:phenylalanine--tRNA ligase subunit beta [Defluviitaleaceae bacterium]
MNIPMSWLREAANIDEETDIFLEKMTDAGNAVEGVTRLGEDITGVVVGRIAALEKHPDADKLWVTQADIGTETLQIVTGADNLKLGDYIPVAVHGSTLANGLKIKKSKMRGLESNGMLCSIDELGYTAADYPEAPENGIYVFPDFDAEKFPLGSDARIPMGLCEEVVDFDVLSNRPDTNCVMGMAREAAAVYGTPFELSAINLKERGQGNTADIVSVEIRDTARCARFTARVVKNVKVGPSPQWLRRRISTAGLRPINNIVDITNYVMLEYGQPLHAFDINTVAVKDGKHGIVVKTADKGQKFTTLDGTERLLNETNLLVADHEKALGIAGVMGGENSMITEETTTILFESANFDASNIRQTARYLGMRTDASARFEKGQDPNQPPISVNRAMELVELLNCGEVVPGVVDVYPVPRTPKVISFDPTEINKLLGISCDILDKEHIRTYLRRVGIKTREAACVAASTADMHRRPHVRPEAGMKLEALIPTFRGDITCAADLAEEVARFYGYNNIKSRYAQAVDGEAALPGAGKTPRRRRQELLKKTMAALGYYEAVTFPFESPKALDKLNIPADCPSRQAIFLKNPLGEDFSMMRNEHTANGLLECISRNYNKGNESASLFEIAYSYYASSLHCGGDSASMSELPMELPRLTIAAYGTDMDFLAFKGDIEELIAALTNRPLIFTPHRTRPYMHPGRAADVAVKTSPNPRDTATVVGFLGELHPAVAKNYEIGTKAYLAELDINLLHEVAETYTFKFTKPHTYPPLDRDLAFKVQEHVPAADLESAIREKGGGHLAEVKLFDVYQGPQVGEGYKSVAYSLRFRDHNRTLAVEDVSKPLAAVLQNLEAKFGAEIRA